MSNDDRLRAIADIVRASGPLGAGPPASEPAPSADQALSDDTCPDGLLSELAALEQNDTDNGTRLLAHFGPELLNVREAGWHVWTKKVWRREGGDEAVMRFAQATAKRIHLEADHMSLLPYELELCRQAKPLRDKPETDLTEDEKTLIEDADRARKALGARRVDRRKFATSCGNIGRVTAMIAQAIPHKTHSPEDLDKDKNLFNCDNGTLKFEMIEDSENPGDQKPNHRLKTTLLPHDRAHLITRMAPVKYDPKAKCPRWDAFMTRFQPDKDVRRFLQVYHGLALTGDTSQQCYVYLWGGGANGKSTFMLALGELFGTYSDTLNAESVSGQGQRRGDQATPDFADLGGVRYLRVSELPRGEPLKEALIKMLTGDDGMKVRHLNKGFFDLHPEFKAAMSGNDLPPISGLDMGIWRRTKLVRWPVMVPEGERRPMREILREFEEERSGILNWLLEGLDIFFQEGLITPAAVAEATDSYREESDPIGSFIAACVNKKPEGSGQSVTARTMYHAFCDWCDANSIRPWRETMFGKVMPQKGITRTKERVRRYLDVELHDVPERASTRSPSTDDAE